MPVHCQDCNHHFLLDASTVASGISCPECSGTTIERDQPSPTHSDGELRNMVDPATQLDQGGNPLQEGVWAGVDGGWQPAYKRDEFFAKTTQGKETVSSHDPRFYLPMEPYMPWTHEATTKEAIAPIVAPLVAAGGRMLLRRALPALMGMAVRGIGNHLQTAPDQEQFQPKPVGLVASEHTAVGVSAPVETPGSVPDMVEDHDPEAVDQQEFNDGDMSTAFNNPNKDDADAGMSQSTGEDGMHQKIEFRHDGEGVQQAEMLLPLILEFIHSDQSALDNPQLKALHETLEKEIPDYINLASENDDDVREFLESLKKPHGVEAKVAAGQEVSPDNIPQRPGLYWTKLSPTTWLQIEVGEDGQVRTTLHGPTARTAAPVYQNTPIPQAQMQMGQGQMPMPGTHQNPIQPGGMSVQGKCMNCGGVTNADGSCPQCGASPGANQMGNMEQPGQQHLQTPGIMPSPYARQAADHQGPVTPQQKEVFAEYLIQQGRNNEVAAMMANPGIYADEWAQYLNRQTQPPEVDPAEQAPQPQMDPSQMGQMPVPGMSVPPPTGPTASTKKSTMGRCPKCESATTSPLNSDGEARCHRCGHIWDVDVVKEKISRVWKVTYQDALNDSPNPVAAPAADATAPGDREQQADSTLTWQDNSGQPLQVGQTYEMHNPGYPIPDVVKIQAVKPDSITVTMEGEYNAPSDPTDANGPGYTHEIDRSELETQGLTFNPVQGNESDEQSQDQAEQDGVGQTVNTEPVEQPHDSFPTHSNFTRMAPMSEYDKYFGGKSGAAAEAKAAMIKQYGEEKGEQVFYATVNKKRKENGETKDSSTDQCPKCAYGHVTSNYLNPELVEYECYRCANKWHVAEDNEGVEAGAATRAWLNESSVQDEISFDPRALAMASSGTSRNIQDIAKRDPRLQQIKERLDSNKTAGAKFSPREQKEFIDEDGIARNADRLNLEGTHYVSAFDNSKARPDRVNDNYLGLGM